MTRSIQTIFQTSWFEIQQSKKLKTIFGLFHARNFSSEIARFDDIRLTILRSILHSRENIPGLDRT